MTKSPDTPKFKLNEDDILMALRLVAEKGYVSTSLFQYTFRWRYIYAEVVAQYLIKNYSLPRFYGYG